jgi:anaerobic carbon-monoxide dehydrogenase iron sulfur subunit
MVKGTNHELGQTRIHVYKTGENRYMQMNCMQCADAACAKVCPSNALKRNASTGAIEVKEDLCVGCALCEAACPFGHMRFDRDLGLPLKCDLCNGNPACARFCPTRALELR